MSQNLEEIEAILKDPTKIITQVSFEIHRDAMATQATGEFKLDEEFLKGMVRSMDKMNAGHIRLRFEECGKLNGNTLLVIVHTPDYEKGWRGKLKQWLVKLDLIND